MNARMIFAVLALSHIQLVPTSVVSFSVFSVLLTTHRTATPLVVYVILRFTPAKAEAHLLVTVVLRDALQAHSVVSPWYATLLVHALTQADSVMV